MTESSLGSFILWLIALVVIVFVATILLRYFYRRATKELAFVRTGLFGEKVVVDGGALVIPVLHEVTNVNMTLMRVELRLGNELAVITKDRMRVNLIAEFFVKVSPSREFVSRAAQSLGRMAWTAEQTQHLLEGRLAAALRAVAAQVSLEELHAKRQAYADAVRSHLVPQLALNGLSAEAVALVDLDQTPISFFDPSNIFDADGLTQLTELIESRRKLRNEIEQNTQIDIRLQNLDAQKRALEIDRDGEYARLAQEREIETRRAAQRAELARERAHSEQASEQSQIAARQEIEQAKLAQERDLTAHRIATEEAAQLREMNRRRTVEAAEITAHEQTEREQIALELALEQARIDRESALQQARLKSDKQIEIATIAKSIELAQKTAERSLALAEAEAARAKAIAAEEQVFTAREREVTERRELTQTITNKAAAEREAERQLIAANAEKQTAQLLGEAAKISAAAASEAEKIKAAGIDAKYESEAKGQNLINQAENNLSDAARLGRLRGKLLDHLEGIIRESVRPMEKIEAIRILHVDGINPGGNGGESGGNRSVTDEVIDSALRYRVQAPMIDSLLKDVGFEGGSVGRLSDVLRDAKDIDSLSKSSKNSRSKKSETGDGKSDGKSDSV